MKLKLCFTVSLEGQYKHREHDSGNIEATHNFTRSVWEKITDQMRRDLLVYRELSLASSATFLVFTSSEVSIPPLLSPRTLRGSRGDQQMVSKSYPSK